MSTERQILAPMWFQLPHRNFVTTKIFQGWIEGPDTWGCKSLVINNRTPILVHAFNDGSPSIPHLYSEEDNEKILRALNELDAVIAECTPIPQEKLT